MSRATEAAIDALPDGLVERLDQRVDDFVGV
jgi:hypothetical protein